MCVSLRVPTAAHMEDVAVYQLSALGFSPFFAQQLGPSHDSEFIPARIAAEHRGAFEVWSTTGAGRAEVAGRLRLELTGASFPAVGDWVVVRGAPRSRRTVVIERVLERRTVFTRGAAGRESCAQVIASNVDLVLVVCGLDADFSVRRIERYLARIWASGAQPMVILNKADLLDDPAARVKEVERRSAAVPIRVVSALHGGGIEAVRTCIHDGMTVALAGSSGAGKSTLVNALLGEAQMRTGEVRASDSRGRHVTTHRQLVLLSGGGLLLDTPGMRELELIDGEGIDTAFEEIAQLASHCRFGDCRHDTEPGCAVKQAVESGFIDAARLDHYRKLEREARANRLRHDEHRRRQAERVWGQLSDEVAKLRQWKGGKP